MSFLILAHDESDRSLEMISYALGCGFLFFVPIYVLPIIVAYRRKHEGLVGITVLNLLGGWTGVGWIAALIWALRSRPAT